MATYILLGTLTDEGRKTVKERPQRIQEVNEEVESFGAKIIAQYAVLGQYDFITVVQAPDNETVARISVEFSSRGTLSLMSLPAFDISVYVNHIVAGNAGRIASLGSGALSPKLHVLSVSFLRAGRARSRTLPGRPPIA